MPDTAFVHCEVCGQDIEAPNYPDHVRAHAEEEAKEKIRDVQDQIPTSS